MRIDIRKGIREGWLLGGQFDYRYRDFRTELAKETLR